MCDSSGVCSDCADGFTLESSPADSCCPTGCSTCTNTNSTIACTACGAGYNFDGSNSCDTCEVSLCDDCSTSLSTCDTCIVGTTPRDSIECSVDNCATPTYFNGLKAGCVTCALGYGKSGSVCASCPSDCAECFADSATCTKCNAGFRVNGGSCEACNVTNCDICDTDVNTCDTCSGTYSYYSTGPFCCAENCAECSVTA